MKNLSLRSLAPCSRVLVALAITGVCSSALAQPAPPAAEAPAEPPVAEKAPPAPPTYGTPIGVPYSEATDEQKDAARTAHKAGHAALQEGRAEEALARFREAHGRVAHPKMRLRIVQMLREMGRLGEAYDEAKILIKEADAAAVKDEKLQQTSIDARDELRAIEEQVGFVVLAKPPAPGSELRVNGRPISPDAWGGPIAAKVGQAEVVAGNMKGSAKVAAGQEVKVTLVAPAPKEAPVDSGGGYDGPDRKLMAVIAGGVGVTGLTLFGVLGAVSQGQFDRLESGCEDPEFCNPNLEPIRDRGVSTQIGANVCLGIGLVGLAAGVGLFTWDLLDPATQEGDVALRPTLVVGPSSVSIQGTF